MSLSYEPLWQMLNDMNITKMEFAKMIGMSNATLAKLGKNEPITLTTVDKICNRFDCQIQNVVKHIHDIQIAQSNFIIDIGMIVLAQDITESERIPIKGNDYIYRSKKRPHVVLEAVLGNGENDPKIIANTPYEKLMYAVAPMYLSSIFNSPLNVAFDEVDIDGKATSGYVAFGKLSVMSSGMFEKKLGIMPESYMKKFHRILQTFYETLDDDEELNQQQ